MRKIFLILAVVLAAACSKVDDAAQAGKFVVKGYFSEETRTSFGTPKASAVPFLWSNGDYIWLGSTKSDPITQDCKLANFEFSQQPSYIGVGRIFYNMYGTTQNPDKAKVQTTQSADGNLGNDGDFGYATLDRFGAFCLSHKTSFLWFNTTTTDSDMPKLTSIKFEAPEGVYIAGERIYDFENNKWADAIENGSNTITLNFEGGYALKSSNEGVMAAMVCLPAQVAGKTVKITYTFADGRVCVEDKTLASSTNFITGGTTRFAKTINKTDLVAPAPELDYELRYLTFEDKDAKFSPYYLDYADDYAGRMIKKWSDLIDDPQYGGPLTYGNDATDAMYYWYDEGNTELTHIFPDNYAYCFWGGGHAISNYWGAGYTNEDRDKHIAKYYGEEYVKDPENVGNDAALGWFCVQLMTPVKAHSGDNFCVHYGYKDHYNGWMVQNLPEWTFGDGNARVIDHMWVTNTNYTLNQLYNGVKSEEGNTFGGNWAGLKDNAWLKIVAQGFDDPEADKDAEPISEVEFYLVQGMNVVVDWQKWDLSGLGKVAKVRFNFAYSDAMGGKYGFTIPGYFAYDDVAVRFEK